MKSYKDDLTFEEFPTNLSWEPDDAIASLERIYLFVNTECQRAIKWYYEKKQRKRFWGYLFRSIAILLVAASGIIPIVSEMYKTETGWYISPTWATIALALAALCISLDRFGGYTSGWIRYIQTGQLLSNHQADFQINWEQEKLLLQGDKLNKETIVQLIKKCRDFLFQVNALVRAETDAWAEDFQKALIELEKKVKEKTEKKS